MNPKLLKFIKRNKKRNADLYKFGLVEGHDYVVCPISGERLSHIKNNYIVKVLGMSIDDYPNVQRVSKRRIDNIKDGLKQIDLVTGLTKYEAGQIEARKTLKQIDSFGLSGYEKKGQKTRATHMTKIDELGRNGYAQIAAHAIIKGNITKANKGLISLNRNEYKRYKLIVIYLTEKLRKKITAGFITGLSGKSHAWHIDHKFSILEGYKQKISPLVIGNINNLEMLPWKENLKKHSGCSIDLGDLLQNCGYSIDDSQKEFDIFTKLIHEDISNNIPPNGAFLIERFYESNLRA